MSDESKKAASATKKPAPKPLKRAGEKSPAAKKPAAKPDSKKTLYRRKIEAQLQEIDAKIDVLKAKVSKAGVDARIELEERLEALRGKRRDLSAGIDRLKDAGEDAWEDLKGGIENAWDEVQEAYADLAKGVSGAVAHFKKPEKRA